MDVDTARRPRPDQVFLKVRRAFDQLAGNHSVFEDLLIVVQVVEEPVECDEPLGQSAL